VPSLRRRNQIHQHNGVVSLLRVRQKVDAVTLDEITESILRHSGCSHGLCQGATRFVPGEGNSEAEVVFVGEAPGATEEKTGRPFVGRAGNLLDELLVEAGMSRPEVYITNVVKARPPDNRDPTPVEIKHHSHWLHAQLKVIAPRLVVPLGSHALKFFCPHITITAAHGMLLTGSPRLFPMYHPSAALHDGRLMDTLYADARMLRTSINWIGT